MNVSKNDDQIDSLEPDGVDSEISSLNWGTIAKEMFRSVVVAVLIIFVVNLFTGRSFVSVGSMLDTLREDEHVLVWKPVYWSSAPDRGDIVVFHHPVTDARDLVKRVVGLPGETLDIERGKVLVDGFPLTEDYVSGDSEPDGTWVVPSDSVFVMGDNREYSSDSRVFGFVPLENVVGKVVFVFYPFTNSRVIIAPEYSLTD